MKVVAAPAPFKGALGPAAAAAAMAAGARAAGANVREVPMADGGEGTLDALVIAAAGRMVRAAARDPLGRPLQAAYGLLPDGTAVVELATASGFERLSDAERDPEATSTAGTGDLIRAALDGGCRRIVLGVGGSATTDGGLGVVIALGARALDAAGEELPGTGGTLAAVRRVDLSGLDPRLGTVPVEVACDVANPFAGPNGAARVFAPQKGADAGAVERLDAGLMNLAAVLVHQGCPDIVRMPRAGAAGGAAGGLAAMIGARLVDGGAVVARAVGLADALADADLCLTGEGRLDGQTRAGKAPAVVAAACGTAGVPCVGLFGAVDVSSAEARAMGFMQARSIASAPRPRAEALAATSADLASAAAEVVALRASS
jgi:glycerate kinase